MGNIQPEITRIAGAKTTLGDYLKANGVAVAAGEKIDALAGKLSDISSLTLDSLSITTPPTQTEYVAGDSFNPAGMVVAANFSNGASLSITNYTWSPAALSAGDTAVTVSLTFGDTMKSVQQAVTVLEAKSIAYTGAYSTKTITSGGVEYTQYTITGSGTLTVQGTYENVSLWLCGGGAKGITGGSGGGGAYCAQYDAQTLSGSYTFVVGAATGASKVTQDSTTVYTANGAKNSNGGTGGGGSGKGDGVTKYPFSDSTTFKCHCAGGGGGVSVRYESGGTRTYYSRGKGGSNGGDGTSGDGTSGGNYGGGNGGSASAGPSQDPEAYAGSRATFYGSGGGGGGYAYDLWNGTANGNGGAGYQGIVYIRVPVEHAPRQSYKYYRLNLTSFMRASSATTAFYNLAELTLYNGASAVSYSGATFSASSTFSGYPVANAFDGKTSTMWHTENVTSAWIQVELSAAASITHFAITPRSDGTYDRPDALSLVASNDGSSWTTLYSGSGLGASWAQSTTKDFNLE